MSRKIFLVEQPTGGYIAYYDTVPAFIFAFDLGAMTGLPLAKETALAEVIKAAEKMVGPSEIYTRRADEFQGSVMGQSVQEIDDSSPVSFRVGDKVCQVQADSTVYGEVAQAEEFAGVPKVDCDENPVLVVIGDDNEIYENLSAWYPVTASKTPEAPQR